MTARKRQVHPRQIHLGAHFPGVNNTTVWRDPRAGSQVDFSSFEHLARTAERGLMDFFFLAEGLRLREQRGKIHDLDVVGRPDTLTVLNSLASVTTHLGLAGTINATFNEAAEVAKQFASLDHLSGGRAAWNVVTSSDAFTGENFRRGGYLAYGDRYVRGGELLDLARSYWDSWADDALVADPETGVFARDIGTVEHHGAQFDVRGTGFLPRSPQGHPVLFQAGDSDDGREFGATYADAIFTMHGTLEAGQKFTADLRSRAVRHGRSGDDLKILPGATFVLGDTPEEARANAREIRFQQVGPEQAIAFLEQVWGRDLSGFDPSGPLPSDEPEVTSTIAQGRTRMTKDPRETARAWREQAEANGWSARELVVEVTGRQQFVGTPDQVAQEMDEYVQADACDGFILVPHLTPAGLDEFVEKVVPLLQERGSYRTEYTGATLREHLGLKHPHAARPAVRASA